MRTGRSMRTPFFAALVAVFVPSAGHANEIPSDLVTAKGALLCASPFRLEEAARAAGAGDDAWLTEMLCVRAPPGVPALRIDPAPIPRQNQPWQVRLQPPGGNGITLWGYFWSFTAKDGTKMMELYRALRPAPRR